MRIHIAAHRFVSRPAPASTRIGGRKEFDVGVARRMLREGATLEDIAAAQGLSRDTVYVRLRRLGLGYLISDRQRRSEQCSRAGKTSHAGEEQ